MSEDLKPVLIAGAGPTGMMAAIELSRFNIPVRLIDKNDKPETTSRAVGVQARTLELLEQRGLASSLVKLGNPGLALSIYGDDRRLFRLDFERTSSDLVITIRDQGKGLDLNKIPDPLAPENLLKTSGRGIFLIRSFMDEVQIHPSQTGTEIKLVKHVHGSAGDVKEASQ